MNLECGTPYTNRKNAQVVLYFILSRSPYKLPKHLIKLTCERIPLDLSHWLPQNSKTCMHPRLHIVTLPSGKSEYEWMDDVNILKTCHMCQGPCSKSFRVVFHHVYECDWCLNSIIFPLYGIQQADWARFNLMRK
jgi:hypothetical protein